MLEESERPGGLIRSSVQGGDFVLEEGPQSFLSTDSLLEMIGYLGLDRDVLRADARAPRFVVVDGKLRRAPLSPPQLLLSSLLGARTKLTFLRDAAGHSVPPEGDESVGAFVRRKFTVELLDRLVSPLVSGIFAGDPERLSLRAAFPTIHEAEKRFGSVIRGAMKFRNAASSASAQDGWHDGGKEPTQPTKHGLISFREGNESLVQALAHSLGKSLLCGVAADSVAYEFRGGEVAGSGFGDERGNADNSPILDARSEGDSSRTQRFIIQATEAGRRRTFEASALIVATPAETAARLVVSLTAGFGTPLREIEYAPVAVISSIYRASQIARQLDGFGFLVPPSEELRVLGTIWNSSLFAGRAPKGYIVLTSFAGGATDPAMGTFPSRDIATIVSKELASVLAISGEPQHSAVKIYPRAIPQYNLGHNQRIAALDALCATIPGLHLAGNYLQGPSVGACVEHARRIANKTSRDLLWPASAASAGSASK